MENDSIYLQVIGCAVFAVGAFVLSMWLRHHPSKKAAEIATRIMHFFFFFTLVIPITAGFTYLGLNWLIISMNALTSVGIVEGS